VTENENVKIADLKSDGMRRINVTGKIVEVSDPREVTTRFGENSRVATAVLQDDTGTIKLSLWNETIDKVHVNDEVQIENGYTSSFRGEIQLNIGRFGKVTVLNR